MVVSSYNGPKHVVSAFVELGLMDRQLRILDILAGSGLVAELVNYNQFSFIRTRS